MRTRTLRTERQGTDAARSLERKLRKALPELTIDAWYDTPRHAITVTAGLPGDTMIDFANESWDADTAAWEAYCLAKAHIEREWLTRAENRSKRLITTS